MKNLLHPALMLIFTSFAPAMDPPILDWKFDQEPNTQDELTDNTGQIKGRLLPGKNPDVLPQLITQDVPCGTAWDYRDSGTSLIMIPKNELEMVGNVSNTKGMAYSFWVKLDNTEGTADHLRAFGWKPVVDCVVAGSDLQFFTLAESADEGNPRRLEKIGTAQGVLDGNWHHVVLTADFTEDAPKAVIYVDSQMTDETLVQFSPQAWESRPSVFGIANQWPGSFGRFQAWSRLLDPAEVTGIFAGQSSH